MIRSSIHTTRTFAASPAGFVLRPGMGWSAVACLGLENQDYQQKQNGQVRFELDI